MAAAILGPGVFRVIRIERELLAVAHGAEPFGGDAERYQISARRQRTPLAQGEVVLRGAALIAVAFDRHDPGAVLLQDLGVGRERLLTFGGNLGAVEIEEDRLQRRRLVD